MNKKLILIDLFENAKILKSERICITDSIILGCNLDYSIFKTLEDENVNRELSELNLTDLSYINKDMSLFVRNIKKDLDNGIDLELIILPDKIIYGNIFIDINSMFQLRQLKNIHYQLLSNIVDNVLYKRLSDVKPLLQNFLSCKSSEKTVVKVDREHMMIVHGNLLPINKSDKVGLDVYSITNNKSLWIYYIIKKSKLINVYIYCLNI